MHPNPPLNLPGIDVGTGALLYALATVSVAQYRKGKLCKPATATSMVIAMTMAVTMQRRYQITRKVFPAGLLTAVSFAMSLFYVWSLVAGPKPAKKVKA